MVKIVTFNLRCDNELDGCNRFLYRKEFIKEKLEKELPDIICFQEVLPHMDAWLRENLPDHTMVGCGREKMLDGERVSVAFKKDRFHLLSMETYWLSPEPYVPGSRYEEQSLCPRTCTELVLQMEGSVFRLINTHLDHIGTKARKQGLQQIVQKVKTERFLPDIPVILAGDFNAEPDSEELAVLKDEGWINLTEGAGITFHGFDEQEKPQSIDYIYIFPQKEKYHVRCMEKWEDRKEELWLSDHYPVCVCIEKQD